jgi:hypothetical protein
MMAAGPNPVDHDASNSTTTSGALVSWDDFTRRLADSLGRKTTTSWHCPRRQAELIGSPSRAMEGMA